MVLVTLEITFQPNFGSKKHYINRCLLSKLWVHTSQNLVRCVRSPEFFLAALGSREGGEGERGGAGFEPSTYLGSRCPTAQVRAPEAAEASVQECQKVPADCTAFPDFLRALS